MPIEIFELVVKATVNDSLQHNNHASMETTPLQGLSSNEKEIAEKVLEIIKRKKER